jgi:hypothetical protein
LGTTDEIRFLKAKLTLVETKFYAVRKLEHELWKEQARTANIHKRLVAAESELRQLRRLLEQRSR